LGRQQGALENLVTVPGRFEPSREFWKGRRIYVTGLTGFKGTWLALTLRQLGASVAGCGLDMPSPFAMVDQVGLSELADLKIIDIRDGAALRRHMSDAAPEFLVHMAAQSQVKDGYADPVGTFDVNATGTAQVLDIARTLKGLKAIVVVSSDKCYENLQRIEPYKENDRLGGHDPYSASKACTEIVATAFRSSFFSEQGGAALATARAGNVIGGGDWASWRLVPDVVRAFSRGEQVVLRRPESIRPWQFVLNSLTGYLMLARALAEQGHAVAQAWNFGPLKSEPVTVVDVVGKFADRFGNGASWTVDRQSSADHDEKILLLDSGASRQRLGWQPNDDLDEAIDLTGAWYKAWAGGGSVERMRDLSFEHIDRWLGSTA
jgi:CDP-glucose 4,6-dehydratase